MSDTSTTARIRRIRAEDAPALASIDEAHTGVPKPAWWEETVRRHVRGGGLIRRVGLVSVEDDGAGGEHVLGYLLGQVRAFEFGSETCGWIYAVGIHPDHLRKGCASALFVEARKRFIEMDVRLVRTMVRRDDVPFLTFFRNQGFTLGPYVELEMSLLEEE